METINFTNRTRTVKNRTSKTSLTYNDKYRINITTTHDKNRKCYRTYVSLVEVEQRENFIVVEKSIGDIFNGWFATTILELSCTRFSELTFNEAIEHSLEYFNASYLSKYETEIARLLLIDKGYVPVIDELAYTTTKENN